MDEDEKKLLSLGLGILSGRINPNNFMVDYSMLGYDVYKFSYYGKPSESEVKAQAEEIVYDAILKIYDRLDQIEAKMRSNQDYR